MTHGQAYDEIMKDIKFHLKEAESVTEGGDLMAAHVQLQKVAKLTEEAIALLEKVSRTAFERVLKEKA